MTTTSEHKLVIHRSNLFQPPILGISAIAISPAQDFIALIRRYNVKTDINQPLSLIEIYSTTTCPRHACSIIEYEELVDVTWTSGKYILSASLDARINIYNMRSGIKVKTLTTDFGPINCFKFSPDFDLLLTGTEYGYAAAYKIGSKGKSIECITKMVKINEPISAIDCHIRPRETVNSKPQARLTHIAPGKRKRSDSSSDETDPEEYPESSEFLEANDISIYGASKEDIIAWDYHKKSIISTIKIGNDVRAMLVLKNGNIVVGDSEGNLGTFDHNSFTCRQSDQFFDMPVRCVATDEKNKTILAGDEDQNLVLLKVDDSSELQDEYKLFENLKNHHGRNTCAMFTSKSKFFIATSSGVLIKFKTSLSGKRKTLSRFTTAPHVMDRIEFFGGKIMAIYGKSLVVYKLERGLSDGEDHPVHQSLPEPRKIYTLRVGVYIHAAAFNDQWICYATRERLALHNIASLSQLETTSKKIPNCHLLSLCCGGQFLIAGYQKNFSVIKLQQDRITTAEEEQQRTNGESNVNIPTHEVVFEFRTKGFVNRIIHHERSNRLIVGCGTPMDLIYTFKMSPDTNQEIQYESRIRLPHSILLIVQNPVDKTDQNIYIYSSKDQLIRVNLTHETIDDSLVTGFNQQDKIRQLPANINISGMLVLNQSKCIIYDNEHMLKIDIETNEVVNENSRFGMITTMDNSIFANSNELILVSATA